MPQYHYLRLSLSPPTQDIFRIRKVLETALTQSFGITAAGTQLDVLWLADTGEEVIIRVQDDDAPRVLAALVATNDLPRMSLVQESPFLPSLVPNVL
ncbi:hypothetical protein BDN72DRAFT_837985 [Pluteus cervinus]|uniref:Uncharacterized protein n=1 Tax=Pluteus cervinus TaxID=181527 RepID=A0ACD3AZV1_9AGAR|nr:hypothetical protein BDN72DRAFT_837985 [Pluteus cervinus]